LTAHPVDSGRAFAHEGDGLFRTVDAGVSWQRSETGLPPGLFLGPLGIADVDNVIYVTAGNLVFRSADAGVTWAPTPAAPSGLLFGVAIDVAPGDSSHVVIASGNRVWTSSDAGASWLAAPALSADVSISGIKFGAGGVLIAGLLNPSSAYPDSALIRSIDGGSSWSAGGVITNVPNVNVLRSAPSDPQRLWLTSFNMLATSADGGLSGVQVDVPAACGTPLTVEPMRTSATGIFVACSTGGLLRSDDATLPVPIWNAIGPSANFVNAGSEPAISNVMAIDAAYPMTARLYAGIGSGVLRSDNNGDGWSRADAGLQEQRVRAIALHPSDNRVALIGTSDGGNNGLPLYSTIDSGATWSDAISGMTTDWVRSIVIDPTTTDNNALTFEPFTAYAAGRTIARLDSADRDASLMKSTDGGASWTPINTGIAMFPSGAGPFTNMGTVRSLVLDPRSCAVPPPGTTFRPMPSSSRWPRSWVQPSTTVLSAFPPTVMRRTRPPTGVRYRVLSRVSKNSKPSPRLWGQKEA
jgi:photosystem II stability/assembly factor-like uncharacterized protein